MASRSVASILVDKSRPLVDDVISVVIRNLCAGQHITVGARCSIKNLSFISYGHYTADRYSHSVCVCQGVGVGMGEMHNTSSYMYGINLLFATYIIELLNFKNIVI